MNVMWNLKKYWAKKQVKIAFKILEILKSDNNSVSEADYFDIRAKF